VFDNVEVTADGCARRGSIRRPALAGRHPHTADGAVASEMVGVSEEVFGRTSPIEGRKQSEKDRRIPGVQHPAAHLYVEIEITRAAVLKALQDARRRFSEHAGQRLAVARPSGGFNRELRLQDGVQMHVAWH